MFRYSLAACSEVRPHSMAPSTIALDALLLAGLAVFAFGHAGVRREPAAVSSSAAVTAPAGPPRDHAAGPVG
jgi:hypothetical protein